MKTIGRRRFARRRGARPLAAKRIALLAAICITVKLLSGFGGSAGGLLSSIAGSPAAGDIIANQIRLFSSENSGENAGSGLALLFSHIPIIASNASDPETVQAPLAGASSGAGENASAEAEDPFSSAETPAQPDSPAASPSPSPSPDVQVVSDSSDGIEIENNTDYDIDVNALMAEGLSMSLGDASSPQVLIVHTHASESYLKEDGQDYEESDAYRTENCDYNVVRVGSELADVLESRGISVIHDTGIYDYPSYNGSYSRTLDVIESYLDQYPSIKVVIDLHRDAMGDDSGSVYKTYADINGTPSAQIMMIVGTDYSGLDHPLWRENLKFALFLESEMNTKYPTLARPVYISQYRYNQHATTGSLIVEVGCNGNTLSEALTAVQYFGDAAADVLLSLE